MKQKSDTERTDRTTEQSEGGSANRIGQYAATTRSAETVTASSAAQPVPAFEPPDHAA